jgi:hypothetical protein
MNDIAVTHRNFIQLSVKRVETPLLSLKVQQDNCWRVGQTISSSILPAGAIVFYLMYVGPCFGIFTIQQSITMRVALTFLLLPIRAFFERNLARSGEL